MFDQVVWSDLTALIGGIEPDLIRLVPTLLEIDVCSARIRPRLEIREARSRRASGQYQKHGEHAPQSSKCWLFHLNIRAEHHGCSLHYGHHGVRGRRVLVRSRGKAQSLPHGIMYTLYPIWASLRGLSLGQDYPREDLRGLWPRSCCLFGCRIVRHGHLGVCEKRHRIDVCLIS